MNNKINEADLSVKMLEHVLINHEGENAKLLSFLFRFTTFIFFLVALIFLFSANSWWGFGIFFVFAIISGFVACYFRAKTIFCLNYIKKELEEKED